MRKPNENYDDDIIRDIEERKELPDATPEEIAFASNKATRNIVRAAIITLIAGFIAVVLYFINNKHQFGL
jgi:hypothetical protein